MTTFLIVIALVAIAYQAFIMIRVLKSDQYSVTQRIAQTILIWGIPIVGAAVCHVVLYTDRHSSRAQDEGFVPATDENPPGIGQDAIHH